MSSEYNSRFLILKITHLGFRRERIIRVTGFIDGENTYGFSINTQIGFRRNRIYRVSQN